MKGQVRQIAPDMCMTHSLTIPYEYLVLAPGSIRPDWLPELTKYANGDLEVGGFTGALIPSQFLVDINYATARHDMEPVEKVLIIGGGVRAVEVAAQLVTSFVHPKEVTIVHNDTSLIRHLNPESDLALRLWLADHHVTVELGEEVVMSRSTLNNLSALQPITSTKQPLFYLRYSRRAVWADKVMNCIEVPNTSFLNSFYTPIVDPEGRINVRLVAL